MCCSEGGEGWVGDCVVVRECNSLLQMHQCSQELEELRRHIEELRQDKEGLEGEVCAVGGLLVCVCAVGGL